MNNSNKKVIPFQVTPYSYPSNRLKDCVDHFDAITDICLEVQRGNIDHMDGAVKICDVTDLYCDQRDAKILSLKPVDNKQSERWRDISNSTMEAYAESVLVLEDMANTLDVVMDTDKKLIEFIAENGLGDEFNEKYKTKITFTSRQEL